MAEAATQEKYPIPRFVIPEGALTAEAKTTPEVEPAPKPAEPAPATEAKTEVEVKEVEDKETTGTDPESVKRSTRSYERRVDRALKQRAEALARADAAEKRLAEAEQKQAPAALGRPKMENFTDIGEFEKAIDKYAREEAVKDYEKKQRDAQNQATHQKLVQGWEQQVTKAVTQYDDFDEKVGELQPTVPWTRAIMRSENGADVAYYLANHRKEAETIFSLDPESQYVEIGRLSQKLMQKVDAPRQPSKAPAPIAPVTGAAAPSDGGIKPGQSPAEYMKIGNKMFRGR